MARVKRGVQSKKRHKKIIKQGPGKDVPKMVDGLL